MFTGLIGEMGIISSVRSEGKGLSFEITTDKEFLKGVKTGDSMAVDGTCLTVTGLREGVFNVFAMKGTVENTILKQWNVLRGKKVNLEKALKTGDRLGGHFVYGHVDFSTDVISVRTEGYSKILKFRLPSQYKTFMVRKGSVAVNGVSLTVYNMDVSSFSVSLIPETMKRTNLILLRAGSFVNIELDVIGKYINNFVKR